MALRLSTERLLLREVEITDAESLFELDSNELVLQHLFGVQGPKSVEDSRVCVRDLQRQYKENGIGRWVVLEKKSNKFVGWAGLKIEHNVFHHDSFFDLGFRFLPEFWNQGYATEASLALIDYGFNTLQAPKICAYVETEGKASCRVLQKAGLRIVSEFTAYGCSNFWLELDNPNI